MYLLHTIPIKIYHILYRIRISYTVYDICDVYKRNVSIYYLCDNANKKTNHLIINYYKSYNL